MFFSIIMPVRNGERFLREAVDSVLAQTFTDWELVCVNDASTDSTADILRDYSKKDVRIKVVDANGNGVSAARNKALGYACGEYVAFMDGDDVLSSAWLQYAHGVIVRTNADLLRCGRVLWFDGRDRPAPVEPTAEALYSGHDAVTWGINHFLSAGQVWQLFVRRSMLNGVIFPEELAVREDVIFCLRLLGRIGTICDTDFKGYIYRLHNASSWHGRRRVEDSAHYPLLLRNEICRLLDSVTDTSAIEAEYSKTLKNNLEEWVVFGGRRDCLRDKRVMDATNEAMALGNGALAWRLRDGLVGWTLKYRSLLVFSLVTRFLWRRARLRASVKTLLLRLLHRNGT